MNAPDLFKRSGVLLTLLAGVIAHDALLASETADELVTRSIGGFKSEREQAAPRDPATLEEHRWSVEEAQTTSDKPETGQASAASLHHGFWIYDADTDLFYDYDADGYYHYLRVWFDADTSFIDARVQARLYLRRPGGSWQLYFVTNPFTITGSAGFDDYEVETELVSGYPTDEYDVLIELYDADFGDFVADYGPFDSSAFSLLPLEDTIADNATPPTVTISRGGGGSASWAMLLVLLFALSRLLHRRMTSTS